MAIGLRLSPQEGRVVKLGAAPEPNTQYSDAELRQAFLHRLATAIYERRVYVALCDLYPANDIDAHEAAWRCELAVQTATPEEVIEAMRLSNSWWGKWVEASPRPPSPRSVTSELVGILLDEIVSEAAA